MCGILGLVFKNQNGFSSNEACFVEDLLYIDALRGMDSTGVAALFTDGVLEVHKEAVEATWFLAHETYKKFHTNLVKNGKAMFGHNRKKTIGEVKDETAHPFIIDNRYAFAHNGTLHTHKHLADTEVDSEALGMVLAKCEGDASLMEKELERVSGAYSCVWIDQEKEMLYLLRNKERPMFIAETDVGVAFCSEPMFLYAAASRNRVKVEKIEATKEETLYSFDLSKYGASFTEKALTIKKAMPPIHSKETGAMVVFGAGTGLKLPKGDLSKNGFKKLKHLVGNTIKWYMDDYIEMDANHNPQHKNTLTDYSCWGSAEDLDCNHIIRGPLHITPTIMQDDYESSLLVAVVRDVTYDVKTKCAIIKVGNIKPQHYVN